MPEWGERPTSYRLTKGHLILAAWLAENYGRSEKAVSGVSMEAKRLFVNDLNDVAVAVHIAQDGSLELIGKVDTVARWLPMRTPGLYRKPSLVMRRAIDRLSRGQVPILSWRSVVEDHWAETHPKKKKAKKRRAKKKVSR